jgi:hypothetical protein
MALTFHNGPTSAVKGKALDVLAGTSFRRLASAVRAKASHGNPRPT